MPTLTLSKSPRFPVSINIAIKLVTLLLSALTTYFLYDLFNERVESTEKQNLQLESQLNLGSLALEIERRKAIISVLDSYFRSAMLVDESQFNGFLAGLPNTSGLEAICWRSTDLKSEFRKGHKPLCDYFSFAEQDKIISTESLLMTSKYTESKMNQQGFLTIFISLQDLLISLPEKEKYTDSLIIFNNSSQQFVRIGRTANSLSPKAVDLTLTEPISRIGDSEVFYLMETRPGAQNHISATEIMVTALTFAVILVTGWFLSHQLNVSQKIKTQVQEQTQNLLEAKKQSDAMRQRAEELAEHKQRFLANMSHEIRTPMNGVLGVVQLLESEALSEKQKEYVRLISQSGNLMVDILNDILDQSKIDAGKIDILKEPCDLNALLQQMLHMFESAALTKDLPLKLLVDPKLPKFIEADPMRLKQIIGNLLSNSLKFTHEGRIAVTAKYFDSFVRISVTDTGIGISEDKLSSIFSEFTQADSSTTRNYGGTGLGLSISCNLLRLMNSELKVKSTLGKGCTFFFDLNVVEVSAPQTSANSSLSTEENQPFIWPKDKRVLVVEDNDINAMFLTAMLEQLNIKFELATNGELALQKFQQDSFDVVLMDCQMPVMDGLTATKHIRNFDTAQPFIIALTANALPDDKAACFDAGMDEFITKPIRKAELTTALSTYLESTKPSKASN